MCRIGYFTNIRDLETEYFSDDFYIMLICEIVHTCTAGKGIVEI